MSTPVYLVALPVAQLTPERRAVFARCRGDRELVFAEGREALAPLMKRTEVAIGQIPRDLIATAPRLQWYQQLGTGVDWLLQHPEAVEKPFLLTNSSDHHCVVIADHLFALILALARQIPHCVEMKKEGRWQLPPDAEGQGLFELRGQTLLLVGLGSIGKMIIKRAEAFEMRVLGVRANPDRPVAGVERIVGPEDLEAVLPEADLVASSLPHTARTEKRFGPAAFAAMKETTLFFNVGRGGTVDEDALCRALHERQIAGAGIDVFREEPLPESSPLWNAPNLLMTPHIGGMHRRMLDVFVEAAMKNVERWAEGRELLNIVDKRAGY